MTLYRFNSLFAVKEILKINLDGQRGIRSKNKDRVAVITGYEGTGKSNLLLCMFEEWLRLIEKPIDPAKDIVYIGDNKKTFITALRNAQKYMMIGHDEAGKDLYARKGMSKFNTDLNVAYQVIRGKNLYTILVIPSIMDLDPFFRKRRVTEMWHVFDTGRVAYFPKKRIRKLIPKLAKAMQYNDDPDVMKMGVSPLFTDTFPLYKGELLEEYLQRKENNMDGVIDELYNVYVNDEKERKKVGNNMTDDPEVQKRIIELRDTGKMKWSDIEARVGLTYQSLKKAYLQGKHSFK